MATDRAVARLPVREPTLAEVRDELLAEVGALRADVAQLTRRRLDLPDADRDRLAPLLPAVFALLGGRIWTVAVLVHLAATDDALAVALAPFVGGLRGLGKLLRRAQGFDVAGFRVRRVGSDRSGAMWVLEVMETRETRTARCDP